MNTAANRIQKQLAELEKTKNGNYVSSERISSLEWLVTVVAPKDSPYEGMTLQLLFRFPQDYPQQPPDVVPQNVIQHLNLKQGCKASLAILHDQWSAFLNISKILLTIEAVLHEPDTQYPLDAELLEAYHEDPAQFQSKAPIKLEGSVQEVIQFSETKSRPALTLGDVMSEGEQRQQGTKQTLKNTKSAAMFERQPSAQPEQTTDHSVNQTLKLCKDEIQKISKLCLELEKEHEVVKNKHILQNIEFQFESLARLRQRVWEKYIGLYTKKLEESLHI